MTASSARVLRARPASPRRAARRVATCGVRLAALHSDGKIVAAGYTANGTNTEFALARINP
jgi:hypothetical protein